MTTKLRITLRYIVLFLVLIITLFPFVWMVLATFKPPGEILTYPPKWLPVNWDFSNYQKMFFSDSVPILTFFKNSMFLAVLGTAGQLFFSSLAAFSFARLNFPGKNIIFLGLIGTMMIPFAVTFIPNFIIMTKIGWYNTYLPLIIPCWLNGVYGIFLLRQFMKTLPISTEESARIDGCSNFKIFLFINLPLTRTALAALAVNTFMGVWNDYLGPLIYLNDMSRYTLPIGLQYFQGLYKTDVGLLMTGATISIVPVIILFVVAQDYFVEGIALSGTKE
ncbi:MAG: carbohydrate ABC transporter permease [Massiliimalia sp.]|jgi:multiple sugar transport system permease protein